MASEIPKEGHDGEKIGEGKQNQPKAPERVQPESGGTSAKDRVLAVPSPAERVKAVQAEQKPETQRVPAAPPVERSMVVQPEQTSGRESIPVVPTVLPRPSVAPPPEPASPPLPRPQETPQPSLAQPGSGEGKKDTPTAQGVTVPRETPRPAAVQPIPVAPASPSFPFPVGQTESRGNEQVGNADRGIVTGETPKPAGAQPTLVAPEQPAIAQSPPQATQVPLPAAPDTALTQPIRNETVAEDPVPVAATSNEGSQQIANTGQQTEKAVADVPQVFLPEGMIAMGQAGQISQPLDLNPQILDRTGTIVTLPSKTTEETEGKDTGTLSRFETRNGTEVTKVVPQNRIEMQPLAKKQKEVLQLVAEGRSNREIGQTLDIASTTIKTHIQAIRHKIPGPPILGIIILGVGNGFVDSASILSDRDPSELDRLTKAERAVLETLMDTPRITGGITDLTAYVAETRGLKRSTIQTQLAKIVGKLGTRDIIHSGAVYAAHNKTAIEERYKIPEVTSQSIETPVTDRERKVIQLIAQGFSTQEIGELLFLAQSTIKDNLSEMRQKFQGPSTLGMIIRGLDEGFVDPKGILKGRDPSEFDSLIKSEEKVLDTLIQIPKDQKDLIGYVAETLGISEHTVKTHLKFIHLKFNTLTTTHSGAIYAAYKKIGIEKKIEVPEVKPEIIDIPPTVQEQVVASRGREAIQLLAQGLSIEEVGKQLSLDTDKIKSCLRSMRKRFGRQSNLGMILQGLDEGFVDRAPILSDRDSSEFDSLTEGQKRVMDALIQIPQERTDLIDYVAETLNLSPLTIKSHLAAISLKFNSRDTTQSGAIYAAYKKQNQANESQPVLQLPHEPRISDAATIA